jgi:hypothetical protein
VTVHVLIPSWPNGDEWRARAVQYVLSHLMSGHPTWKVSLSGHEGGAWSKGEAVKGSLWARDIAQGDVCVVSDADVVVDPARLRDAVAEVEEGETRWAMPHTKVVRLDEHATRHLYDEGRVPDNPTLDRPVYRGWEAGGLVVLRAEVLADCPMDPRFRGWGSEDIAWGQALRCLHGAPWRGDANLYHLHHPHPAPGQSKNTSYEGRELARRYYAAKSNPDAMRALLAEIV